MESNQTTEQSWVHDFAFGTTSNFNLVKVERSAKTGSLFPRIGTSVTSAYWAKWSCYSV